MTFPGEEFVIGHVATESSYDPSWDTPTWFDLWSLLDEQSITNFVIVPLGKIGSDKRAIGSTSVITDKDSVMNVLSEYAKQYMQEINPAGDPNNPPDVRAARAIIWIDPSYSAFLTEDLCFLLNPIVHLTGWAIRVIS
jgi:hypothetical protein